MRKVPAFLTIVILFSIMMLTSVVYALGPPVIEQHIFVHYARGGKPKPPSEDMGYYKLLGAKWKSLPVKLEVNPDKSNLGTEFVLIAIQLAAEEWDDGGYSKWGGVSVNLFSDDISIVDDKGYDDLAWTNSKLDGRNTIVWGNYPTQEVIAVTIVWINKATKTIIEFDMVLDTDFTWGDAEKDSSVMDLQNIVTHELGHGVGLNDLYQSVAYQETMYGYSKEGEIIKRDLYIGDQTGIKKLYES